jgi:prevent-host-death family protein
MTIVMTMDKIITRTISASAFKARCLALMDEVESTGEIIVITKNGKPVAQLAPARAHNGKSVFGIHKGRVAPIGDVDLTEPVVDAGHWAADVAITAKPKR